MIKKIVFEAVVVFLTLTGLVFLSFFLYGYTHYDPTLPMETEQGRAIHQHYVQFGALVDSMVDLLLYVTGVFTVIRCLSNYLKKHSAIPQLENNQ